MFANAPLFDPFVGSLRKAWFLLQTLLVDVAIAGGTAGDHGRQWRESSQTSGIRNYTSIRGSELMILYCRERNCTFSP